MRGDIMTLGERLIKLRKEKNLSQEEVAEKLNVTRQTISKWETDTSTPDFDKIIPLCELYGITSDELLTGKKESKKTSGESLSTDTVDNHECYSSKTTTPVDNTQIIKRAEGIGLGVFLYFISIVWIMIAIPVLLMNPILASAIFMIICGLATFVIIYTAIVYKKEKIVDESKEDFTNNPLIKQIESIISLLTVIIYLGVSFLTMAWHVTWIIWLIYALVMEIVKLIISLKGDDHAK